MFGWSSNWTPICFNDLLIALALPFFIPFLSLRILLDHILPSPFFAKIKCFLRFSAQLIQAFRLIYIYNSLTCNFYSPKPVPKICSFKDLRFNRAENFIRPHCSDQWSVWSVSRIEIENFDSEKADQKSLQLSNLNTE